MIINNVYDKETHMSQKENVFKVVCAVIGGEENIVNNKVDLNTEQRKEVVGILIEATLRDEIVIGGKSKNYDHTTEEGMKNVKEYWPGTLNNWLRKDTRLNGGEPYKTKNPGSRTGIHNKEIKATRGYIKQLEAKQAAGEDVSELLHKATTILDKLLAEEAAKKAEKAGTAVNMDDLPEELKALAM